ncbi:MAG: hypothetical protein M3349_02950 [Actinomycetota bacterium]|nr:hypothetical protein [Actinomycetota bacterium]
MHLWFAVVSALLVASGYAKVANPTPTVGALQAAGLPSGRRLVTNLGVIEVVAGLAGLALGGRLGGLPVAVVYAGLAGFVVVALVRRWPIQSCGCLARIDTPPTWVHVAFNAVAAGSAVWRVVTEPPSIIDTAVGLGWWGVAYVAAVVLGVVLAHQLVFALPSRMGRRAPQRA